MNAAKHLVASIALLVALPALALPACGGGDDDGEGGSSSSSGPGVSGGQGDDLGLTGGDGEGSGSGDGACVASNATAELRPLDLYVMLDQSGSMVGYYDQSMYSGCTDAANADGITPISRWQDVTGALNGFMSDPQSAGVNVGLGFFPPKGEQAAGQAKCEDNKCEISAYSTPEVGIGALPGNAAAIAEALDFTPCPCNGTPMSAALQGAVKYARERAAAKPDHVVAVVLATDGEPNGACSGAPNDGEEYAHPIEVAVGALAGSPSIPVYVIGVGNMLTSLHAIAEAGGTGDAFLVDGGQGTQQAFIDALNAIRGAALPCEIQIPPPPAGETLDPAKVNVVYRPGDGSDEVTLTRVNGPEGCAQAPKSWYYDDAADPSRIILCPAACAMVKGDGAAGLHVGFGCASVVAE